jgi:hypothetical protein
VGFDAALHDHFTGSLDAADASISIEAKVDAAFERAEARRVGTDSIQLARAEIRKTPEGSMIDIRPEEDLAKGLPNLTLPNTVGATGFGRDMWQHDYLYVTPAPSDLQGPEALAAVNKALRANPTPGKDQPASPNGTRNDVGDITVMDGDDNFVKSFVVPTFSDKPTATAPARTDTVVNYTVKGEHILDEGFVMRYGVMGADGSISIVTYGEGNGSLQVEALEGIWGGQARDVWKTVDGEVFDAARRMMAK